MVRVYLHCKRKEYGKSMDERKKCEISKKKKEKKRKKCERAWKAQTREASLGFDEVSRDR